VEAESRSGGPSASHHADSHQAQSPVCRERSQSPSEAPGCLNRDAKRITGQKRGLIPSTGLGVSASSSVQVLLPVPRGMYPERTAFVNQTFPTLYEAIAPMLRFSRFGLCVYKMPGSSAGARDDGQQSCLAEAKVCDLSSHQEMCLAHFELVRAS
jgi:hypothetical protein